MPIPRRNFDLRILPEVEEWMVSIALFLSGRRGDAFDKSELIGQAAPSRNVKLRESAMSAVGVALAELIERGAIEQRLVDDEEYYAFKADISTQNWELL